MVSDESVNFRAPVKSVCLCIQADTEMALWLALKTFKLLSLCSLLPHLQRSFCWPMVILTLDSHLTVRDPVLRTKVESHWSRFWCQTLPCSLLHTDMCRTHTWEYTHRYRYIHNKALYITVIFQLKRSFWEDKWQHFQIKLLVWDLLQVKGWGTRWGHGVGTWRRCDCAWEIDELLKLG